MESSPRADSELPLAGGKLCWRRSRPASSAILREHYGRGPMKAKTYALDDIIVVVMRGSGFTPLEQTIMDSGEPERVIAMREDFQRVMADALQRDDRGADRPQRPRVPLPSPRRARHHDGDLLRRRSAPRLRRSRGHRTRIARNARRIRSALAGRPTDRSQGGSAPRSTTPRATSRARCRRCLSQGRGCAARGRRRELYGQRRWRQGTWPGGTCARVGRTGPRPCAIERTRATKE